jgi:Cupin
VRTRVAGPWGFAVQPREAVVFHFVGEGRAFVRQPDAETMALQAGELVLLPRGSARRQGPPGSHRSENKALPCTAATTETRKIVSVSMPVLNSIFAM